MKELKPLLEGYVPGGGKTFNRTMKELKLRSLNELNQFLKAF